MPSYYRDASAPAPNAPRRIGVTALVERDGRVLVERRRDDADVWAVVGGTLEQGENVLEALARELAEETGLLVEEARLLGIFSDPTRVVAYPDGTVCRITSIAFRVTPQGNGDPAPSDESAGMRFVSRSELSRLPLWPVHLPIRDAFLADLAEPVVA